MEDGTPVFEFAARYMSDRVLADAKAMACTMDIGGPMFRWSEVLGTSGWGPCARPNPECFLDLSKADFQ